MSRLRMDFVHGTISSVSDSATTLSSLGFAQLPEIVDAAGFWMAITIDPGVDGAREIVHITAHDTAATSVTVLRGQEGTTAVAHDADTAWVHAATAMDFKRVINTDGDPGETIFVGQTDPDGLFPLEVGDVWIRPVEEI